MNEARQRNNGQSDARRRTGWRRALGLMDKLAWLPVPASLLAMLGLWAFGSPRSFESPYLLLMSNLLFSTLISGIISYRIGRVFLAHGRPGLLLLGCGVLMWGVAGLGSTLVVLAESGSGLSDVNTLITIHNTCIWVSAICHLTGAAVFLKWNESLLRPRIWLALAGTAVSAVAGVIILAALRGWLPPFFAPGLGGTLVRQFVLGSAVAMFVLSALLLRLLNRLHVFSFARWYGYALLLLAVGFFGTWLQKVTASPLGWAARSTQYLGFVYMLVATVKSAHEPYSEEGTLEQGLSLARQRFGVAVSTAVASVCFASAFRLLFLQSLGLKAPFITFFPAVMMAALFGGLWSGLMATVFSTVAVCFFLMEPVGVLGLPDRVDALSMAIFVANGVIVSWMASSLHRANARAAVAETEVRFAAERERAARALSESEERYRALVMTAPISVLELDREGTIRFVNRCSEGFQISAVTGSSSYDYLEPDSRPVLAEALADAFRCRKLKRFELRGLGKNRELRWYESFLGPVVIGGAVSSAVLVSVDITERKHLQERYRELFDQSPMGIALVDSLSGRVSEANPRFAEIVGRTRDEIESIDWMSITHPDDLEASRACVALAKAGGAGKFAINKRYVRPDGSLVWVNMTLVPVSAEAGADPRHLCTVEDITEAKLAQDSLLKLSTAVEQSPVSVVITDTRGNIEFVNPMFTELTGYGKEEVLGKNPRLLKSDTTEPDIYRDMWGTICSGNLWEGEFRNKKKSGELFWEKVKISPVKNSEGAVTHFIGIKENITRQKNAEDLLRRSEERFRQLFDQSNDAIVIVSKKDYAIIDCNGETEKIFGYRRDELVDVDIFTLMVNADRSFKKMLLKLDQNYWQIDKIAIVKKDGSQLLVSMRFKMITLNADQVFYCSFRDITDRILSEQQALAAQANLIQAEKMASLGLLVSGMAHEINNPNNCILFNAELLVRTWNSTLPILEEFYRENGEFKLGSFKFSETRDIIPKLFSGLVDGAERIRGIVDMLKDFARQDKGDALGPFDVNQVLSNAIAIVNHEIKKRCGRFYLEAGHDLPPALGNAQQIEQVMINLIMNALQSLGGLDRAIRLHTSLAQDGERILITVADEGEGMSVEVMERLMDPFFTTKGDSGGTGLGLSISASILRKNQGAISFVSAPGEGTTAKVELRVFGERH